MRLLYIEDSMRLQTYVGKALRSVGHALDATTNGEEGLWLARENPYDVIILDLMLPDLDGISILKTLREEGNTASILILTARDTVDERVHGLGCGADDYLVKPFATEELLARVATLSRRRYGLRRPRITVGDLEIDTAARTVWRDGEELVLQPREYALLEYLALHAGEVVSRSDIESHIYDERAEPRSNVVDAMVCVLRKRLDRPGAPSHIRTRRGHGYVLEGDVP